MQVTYIGPFDAVELDGVGVVTNGVPFDVSAEVAGSAPDPRVDAAHLELRDAVGALEHERAKALREEIIGLDHGSGLLAQSGNWVAVSKSKKKSDADGPDIP